MNADEQSPPSLFTRISLPRVLGCLAAILLLLCASAAVPVMKVLANLEGAEEYWQKLDAPREVEQYEWSGWQRGGGAVSVPPRDDLQGASIESHRFARRQTLFKDYLFCEARYLLKDGSMKVAYARCPAKHVTVRQGHAEALAGVIGAAGITLLALCVFWPKRKATVMGNG